MALASLAYQVGFVKDQSVFRLVPTSGSVTFDRDQDTYVPASVGVSVTRSDGVALESDILPSAYGLKIMGRVIFSDGTSTVASDVTSSPSLSLGTLKTVKEKAAVEFTLLRTLGAAEAEIDRVSVPVVSNGQAASIYELFSVDASVHFDSSGQTSSQGVTVVPNRITGSSREALDVTSSNSKYVCFLSTKAPTSGSMATLNRAVVQATSLTAAQVKTLTYARFDLLLRSDVTFMAVAQGAATEMVRYADSRVLASRQVIITRDGVGEPGAFTSIVFSRAVNQPAQPVGGTYSDPIPQPGNEQDPAWSDAPTSGTAPLWMSRARFLPSMDGSASAPSPEWSMPTLANDSADIEIIWSASEEPATPVKQHPYTSAGDWTKSPSDAIWMAVAVKSAGSWGAWVISRIRGEGAVSIVVSPANVVASGGKISTMYIQVRMYVGEKQVTPSAISGLFTGSTGGTDATTGLKWGFYNGDGYLGYRLLPCTLLKESFVCTPRLTYRGEEYPFAVQFSTAPAGVGKTGPFCPPPARWEDYPAGYAFQSGTNPDDTASDTVIHGRDTVTGKFKLWRCKQNHQKSADKEPASGSQYWDLTMMQDIVASQVFMGERGYIGLFSTQAIRIYNTVSQVVGQLCAPGPGYDLPFFLGGVMDPATGAFDNATGPLMALDENGKAYFGGTAGQRIELDPLGKTMSVYGSDGKLRAQHSGRHIPVSEVTKQASTSGTKTVGRSLITKSAANQTLNGSLTLAANTLSGVSGTLKVSVPAMVMKAKTGSYVTVPGQLVRLSSVTIYLEVIVDGVKRVSRMLGSCVDTGDDTVTSPAATVSTYIAEGETYGISLRYELVATGTGSASSFSAQADLTYLLESTGQISHFGGNGFYVASGNQNYFYVLFDTAGKLHCKCVCAGVKIFGND